MATPGGRLVLSTPAWQHRYGAADQLVGHFRRYDRDLLHQVVTDAGADGVGGERQGLFHPHAGAGDAGAMPASALPT